MCALARRQTVTSYARKVPERVAPLAARTRAARQPANGHARALRTPGDPAFPGPILKRFEKKQRKTPAAKKAALGSRNAILPGLVERASERARSERQPVQPAEVVGPRPERLERKVARCGAAVLLLRLVLVLVLVRVLVRRRRRRRRRGGLLEGQRRRPPVFERRRRVQRRCDRGGW